MPDDAVIRPAPTVGGDADPRGSRGVVVAGMHRSGTSALAGALLASGFVGGSAEQLLPAGNANPAGFAERRDVVAFDEELLAALGWGWDTPPLIPPETLEVDPTLIERGRQLAAGFAGGNAPWCVKDPRISLVLPCWRRILDDRFVTVVSVRDPAEVATSLAGRDGFPFELGLAVWAAYHRHLARGLAGRAAVIVDYRELVERPTEVLGRVLTDVGRLGVEGRFDVVAAASTVRPALRRATVTPDAAGAARLGDLADAHAAWLRVAARPERITVDAPPPTAWETAVLETHRRGRLTRVERTGLESRLSRAERRLETTQQRLHTVRAERDALVAAAAARQPDHREPSLDLDRWRRSRAARMIERARAAVRR
jgi:hypothetical protein